MRSRLTLSVLRAELVDRAELRCARVDEGVLRLLDRPQLAQALLEIGALTTLGPGAAALERRQGGQPVRPGPRQAERRALAVTLG